MTNPLEQLQKLGQSPWIDNIHRESLNSGELEGHIKAHHITGLTSNPTIFEQAMSKSPAYESELAELARAGHSAGEIYERLAVSDIKRATQLFHGVWERAQGKDGFVSLEVSPQLAHDTEATTREAARLWKLVDAPNLMVKIPATRAGLAAIERSIAAGVSVNVTLIFSLERYGEVIDAFQAGIKKRIEAKQPVSQIASVASFFVSRVDTAVDKLLDERAAAGGPHDVIDAHKGKAAIANAKLAYKLFLERFATPEWRALEQAGAHKQRPLWASTSTKNPKYPDLYYVEALIGPDTVDTLPPATLAAFLDHGKPEARLTQGVDEASAQLAQLGKLGIDMRKVTDKLEADGVASFAHSFETLLQAVERRRKELGR